MALKFSTTKDAKGSINVLVYGRSGVGKTSLIATAPKPIIISTESGLLSIAKFDLPVIEISTLDDLMEAYEFVSTDKSLKKYKTVCLDSISDIAETVLADLIQNCKDPRQAYGQLAGGVGGAIRKFRDLKCSTYFIAKAEVYENSGGMQALRPSMPGKNLTNGIDYFFDELLCLRIGEDDDDKQYRYLQTQPTTTVDAKDRSRNLDPQEPPDLKKLFKKLQQ